MLPPGSNHLLYYVHLDDRAKDLQIHLTLMMTSAQVVETSVTTTDNNPSQDYTHPDDQTTLLINLVIF